MKKDWLTSLSLAFTVVGCSLFIVLESKIPVYILLGIGLLLGIIALIKKAKQ